MLQVDLAGHRLHPVNHGGYALGYLDALQPLPGDIVEPEGCRQTAHHGAVFVQHLRIDAILAQESDLTRAGNGIGIAHGHARRVFEAFGQVAAGHFAEAGCGNDFRAEVFVFGKEIGVSTRYEDRLVQRVALLWRLLRADRDRLQDTKPRKEE